MGVFSDVTGATKGALWPFLPLFNMVTLSDPPATAPDEKGSFSGGTLRPYNDKISDYVGVQFGSVFKIVLATVCWVYTVDMTAAAEGYNLSLNGWVMQIVGRDLLLMLVVCGGWNWVLYSSPLKEKLAPYKINSSYPDNAQMRRDVFWTISATLLGSAQEVLLMRWWAGGYFQRPLFGSVVGEEAVPWGEANTFFGTKETAVFSGPELPFIGVLYFHQYTMYFIMWIATMLYWRIAHFFLIHRGMHPWWDRNNTLAQGDLGAVLYRYVHSHHHKSYNPTSWSGISMLPIESISYISAALIPLFFRCGCHPWLHLYTKLDLVIGAQVGHDGFDEPGGASYYHQLHHAHFECNYGDAAFPLDWIFGCFEDGTKWAKTDKDTSDAPLLKKERDATQPVTMEEVSKHSTQEDCWIVLHGTALDVTSFLADHPGGDKVILAKAGTDATAAFELIHKKSGGTALIKKWAPEAPVGFVPDLVTSSKDAEEVLSAGGSGSVSKALPGVLAQLSLNAVFVVLCVGSWIMVMGSKFW